MTKTKKSGENNPEKNMQIMYVGIGKNSYICIIMGIPKDKNIECKIYKLMNPITREIRYIGKTTQGLNRRLQRHISSSYNCKYYSCNWIQSLLKQELKPIIEEIETTTWEESAEREIFWINYFKELGYKLCNLTKGGEGVVGYTLTNETKKKMSESRIKKLYCYHLYTGLVNIFKSRNEAAKYFNVKPNAIYRTLRGERESYKNHIFSNIELSQEDIKNIKDSFKSKIRKVKQFDLDNNLINEFKTVQEAAIKTGVTAGSIYTNDYQSITKRCKFIWRIERA